MFLVACVHQEKRSSVTLIELLLCSVKRDGKKVHLSSVFLKGSRVELELCPLATTDELICNVDATLLPEERVSRDGQPLHCRSTHRYEDATSHNIHSSQL
jgi:hypothetical protein